ncbi:MAG: tRNA-dihydrouridine synthase [Alkalibacterium sp.]|nr:tRNA-dihydrouridine synthase [Alkalibacterium sp.]
MERYVNAAAVAQKAGFSGVQIHGAHGYLVSQFLSAHDNQRNDRYGGSLENRMRFLLEIYTGMREKLGKDFPISIKMNASDFNEGGFSEEDSLQVATRLADLGIDLIEISGGNYENPKMFRQTGKDKEEIFFIDYAEKIKNSIDIPVVVTGGFRSIESMEEALRQNKTSMIGLARPLALVPDLPNQMLEKELTHVHTPRLTTGIAFLDGKVGAFAGISYYEQQMHRLCRRQGVRVHQNAWLPILHTLKSHGLTGLMPRR